MPDLAKLTFSTHPSSTTRTISQPHLSLDLHNHHHPGMSSMHTISVPIVKGDRGFGFTVADAALGQIVKDIVQPLRYTLALFQTAKILSDVDPCSQMI